LTSGSLYPTEYNGNCILLTQLNTALDLMADKSERGLSLSSHRPVKIGAMAYFGCLGCFFGGSAAKKTPQIHLSRTDD
jgi:hypothetical protein